MKSILHFFILSLLLVSCESQPSNHLSPSVLIVQPIVVQSDQGDQPASMALPEELVDSAYSKAGVDFHFLEPLFFNNTAARDGLINLDSIVKIAHQTGLIKGQNDLVTMFFVNAVDGKKGPLGRGMMHGNLAFIALGNHLKKENRAMQAFVIAHEVGHNLGLQHAVDDPNVPDDLPNLQGDGLFEDRIDPKNSLNDYQIKALHKSPLVLPRIDFLEPQRAAQAILDESYEPYFSQLQIREIEAFTNTKVPTDSLLEARAYAKKKFASAVTHFTTNEKACISYVVDNVNTLLLQNGISMMAKHPWRFIKIEDWLCGGFAHTRGTYIILSQKHIDHLSETWSDAMTPDDAQTLLERFGGLLVHEQMHSLQRTFTSKFHTLYSEYWNFKNAKVTPALDIITNQVSNPDAPIAEWLIPNPKTAHSYYWLRTLLKPTDGIPIMGKDFEDKVFIVEPQSATFKVATDSKGQLKYTHLDSIPFYKEAFPVTRGIDHPNEISAYMFSEYFKALVSKQVPFKEADAKSQKNTKAFIQWIQQHMTYTPMGGSH